MRTEGSDTMAKGAQSLRRRRPATASKAGEVMSPTSSVDSLKSKKHWAVKEAGEFFHDLPRRLCFFSAIGAGMVVWTAVFGTKHLARHHHSKQMKQYQGYNMLGIDDWVLQMHGDDGYFIDIGAFPYSGFSNSRLLEENGWEGICADPMPRGFEDRKCGFIPRPISGQSGETMPAPARSDCEQGVYNVSGSFHEPCSTDRVTSLGIRDLLSITEAPEVVDFVSIARRGLGEEILAAFPWETHCVRYWVFELSRQESDISFLRFENASSFDLEAAAAAALAPFPEEEARMMAVLKAHKCRTATKGVDLWAACSCKGDTGKIGRIVDEEVGAKAPGHE